MPTLDRLLLLLMRLDDLVVSLWTIVTYTRQVSGELIHMMEDGINQSSLLAVKTEN